MALILTLFTGVSVYAVGVEQLPPSDNTDVSNTSTASTTPELPPSDNTDVSATTTASTTPELPPSDNTDVSATTTASTTPELPPSDNTDVSGTTTASTTPEIIVNGGGAGNGGFPTGGSTGGGSGTTLATGTPVSAIATSTITTFDTTGINLMCSNLIVNYSGINKRNVMAEVIKLQTFLNAELGLRLAVDGKFGRATLAAVKAFQLKYATSVLLPWDQAGLSVNLVNRPTGYVYKTTLRQINLLQCPSMDIPMPKLP